MRPTNKALKGMERMYKAAEACEGPILLLQTPAGLRPSTESFEGVESFFEAVSGDSFQLAWETRGESWEVSEARSKLRSLLRRFRVIHVTDPLKLKPVWVGDAAYFRLHGLPGYNLRYSYTNAQLEELHRRLRDLHADKIFVFFNNYAMYRDAYRFRRLLINGELPPSPFGPASISWALRGFDKWPTSKDVLLERCGRWRCWVEPSRSIPLERILKHLDDRNYHDVKEVLENAERLWVELGYPSAGEVEEKSRRALGA